MRMTLPRQLHDAAASRERFRPMFLRGFEKARHVGHGDEIRNRIELAEVSLALGKELPRFLVALESGEGSDARQKDTMRLSRPADLPIERLGALEEPVGGA